MSGTRRLVIALALLLVSSGFAQTSEPRPGKPQKSTTGAMLRSLVVPGWGQAYNEAWWKAGIFLATESLQLTYISQKHDDMLSSKRYDRMPEQYPVGSDEYLEALAYNAEKNHSEQNDREARNRMIWWFAGTVLLSLGDAYVDAHLYGLDFSPDISYHDGARVGVTATVSF